MSLCGGWGRQTVRIHRVSVCLSVCRKRRRPRNAEHGTRVQVFQRSDEATKQSVNTAGTLNDTEIQKIIMSSGNRFDDGGDRGRDSSDDGFRRAGGPRQGGGGFRGGDNDDRRSGGGYRDRDRGGYGQSRGDDRGGGNWRGGGGGPSRFGSSEGSSSGQRPRLNLKPRTVDGSSSSNAMSTNDSSNTAETSKLSKMSLGEGGGGGGNADDSKNRREPAAVNSRAAAFGSAPEYRHSDLRAREVSCVIVNELFLLKTFPSHLHSFFVPLVCL